ncbi:MAG: hypothetical protein ABUS49_09510 [Acidobacteriota bacterium]
MVAAALAWTSLRAISFLAEPRRQAGERMLSDGEDEREKTGTEVLAVRENATAARLLVLVLAGLMAACSLTVGSVARQMKGALGGIGKHGDHAGLMRNPYHLKLTGWYGVPCFPRAIP